MANVPLKVLLFCTGLLVAGASTAYYKGVFSPAKEQAPEMASLAVPQAPAASETKQSSQGAPALPNVAAETDASQGRAGQSPDGAASGHAAGSPTAANNIVVPTFDVVRVEPDGSMVVAGRAVPGAEVEVLSGSSVLATTRANDAGEFAAVLDKALKPGEHNIVLRGTSPDSVATSVETAIVSIPSGEEGQVVALVQQPGEPSRLITVPQPRQPSHTVEKEENGQVASDAETNGATVPQDQSAAREEQDTPTDQGGGAEAVARADADDAASGNAVNGDSEAVAEGATSGDAANVSPFIEAVEIDGREVFVAGRAEPGRRIRVYVNDILLGQTDVSPEGAFLIEAERELPAGDYIIRADVLGDDGSTVIARAAVPFERPAADRFAAVAGQTTHQIAPGELDKDAGSSANSQANSAPATGNDAGGAERPAQVQTGIQDGNASPSNQRASASEPKARGSAGTGGGSHDVVMSPLEPSDGSVIIRRGDTLWHISRRVYGHGVRYSTIYLANRDQIRNPNLIYPGQIFKLPEETEQGERANLNAISEQALSPDQGTPDSDS